jgi:restriction system-associated AAA family ATPase
MKLLRVHIISAETCGGLLDGLDLWLRSPDCDHKSFEPLCFIGPNGSGKSQFLQILAEIFQSIVHQFSSAEERLESNADLLFEIEYLIRPKKAVKPVHVKITRDKKGSKKPHLTVQKKHNGAWVEYDTVKGDAISLLPKNIVGYTSGNNETLSLPFLVSRSGYAEDVRERALLKSDPSAFNPVPDSRLMLIDYGTHLEVLAANLLLGSKKQRQFLLQEANIDDLHSFRCIVQLKPSSGPNQGVSLTNELERYVENLRRCSTCHNFDEKSKAYTFDFWINDQTREAFKHFWDSTLELYGAFHKISMLNDLAIPKTARDRFKRDTKTRKFASRLPEPQDEEKIFRFERVNFRSSKKGGIVDYVSLSDGEHQLEQILGTMSMLSSSNILFLLDEPESHFNPHWRVKFISRIMSCPTNNGIRSAESEVSEQECLLTTHAPFVPSDMPRNQIFIFSKDKNGKIQVRKPETETYGSTFDTILEECFDISPPISKTPLKEIESLMKSKDIEEIREGINRLGHSVDKVFLADHLRQLTKQEKN